MKAIIRLDVPEWQIGQEVKVYFHDTMCVTGTCEDEENILKDTLGSCYLDEKESNKLYAGGLIMNNLNHTCYTLSRNSNRCDVCGAPLPNSLGDTPTIKPKRKFIRIITTYYSDDLICYEEYKGKPYFSIEYQENGETIVGYGTYNPDVLSRYLRDYFLKEE